MSIDPILAKGPTATIDDLVEAARSVRRAKNVNSLFHDYRRVDPEESERLRQVTARELLGYVHSADEAAVRHVLKQHGGTERNTASIPVIAEDLHLLPLITSSPDSIVIGNPGRSGELRIVYAKRVGHLHVVVEEVLVGRKKLMLKTMYKKKER